MLSLITILGASVLLSLAYLVSVVLYNLLFHPLASVPGPKIYACSQLPYLRKIAAGRWPFRLTELHDKYGPVVRFGPNDVSFITAEAWKEIYGHRKKGELPFSKDTRVYGVTYTGQPNIITVPSEADHSRMRRLLSHAFSEKALRNQEDLMKIHIDLLITRLKSKANNGEVVDMVRWYNYCTFDLIGDLAFGEPFGCLKDGEYHPWVSMIFSGVKSAAYSLLLRRLPYLAPLKPLFVPRKLFQARHENGRLSIEKAQKRVKAGSTSRPDFMSFILRHNDEKGLSEVELGENAIILIIGGSETTATLLSGATFYLLRNPEAYRRVVDEIRTAFKTEDEITLQGVSNLEYLLAVFNETLRMYPPVPTGLPRIVPKGGRAISGHWMPEGTSVSIPHWAAYHSRLNWISPYEFFPERWIGDGKFPEDNRDVMQPFSTGARNCIGQNLAIVEMKLIVARVLWNFDMELMADSLEWNKQNTYLLWEKGAINVRLHPVKRSTNN
ncbi:Isotrichodermin C-15 hydroxylase [Fusarium coicis]|nr:Isotrichodermin C-15 hydroxylase [Fusarium coicis]